MIVTLYKKIISNYNINIVSLGNIDNKYGRSLKERYKTPSVKFSLPVYNKPVINTLRYFSEIYFHGHSVGGTNPSLLEAMGCGCRIAAHENAFNKSVLGEEGEYFSTAEDVSKIITTKPEFIERNKKANLEKILTVYSPENMVMAYEDLMKKSIISYPVSRH